MRTLAVLSLGFALSVPAFALDFRSVSDNAVLYDAPSSKGVKHFIIVRGSPVEVVLSSQSPGRPKIDLAPTGGGSGQRPESGVQPIQEN